MDQLIFDNLRIQLEQTLLTKKQEIDKQCYTEHKKSLDNANLYAICVQDKIKQMAEYEQKAKYRLIFMQMMLRKKKQSKQEYSLVEEVGKFMKQYGIQVGQLEKSIV